MKKVGVIVGREWSFPPKFIDEVNRRDKGVVAEFAKLGGTRMDEKLPYAVDRYVKETSRLYAVLDARLADREYLAHEYSIADMASYPWIVPYQRQQQNLEDFPNLKRWFDAIRARPAVIRAYEKGKAISAQPVVDDEAKKFLFGQSAATVRR